MPLFITDEELESLRSNDNNVTFIVSKADSFITNLQRQLETVKAQSEASSITAEQTCSLVEQKYISLSSDFEKLESQNAELNAAIERNLEELAVVKSEKHRIHLESIEKDGTIERLSAEVSEIHKSKRQLLGIIEQKDTEIKEKNTTIKSYLDKIVNLTEAAALKQSQLHEREAEFARSQATCARLSQEKELIEKHNVWLNEELTTKVHDLIQVRKARAEAEADISAKLADAEKSYNECSSSLKWNKERVKELEGKLASLQEELCYSKTTAAENEERFTAELSTIDQLVVQAVEVEGTYKKGKEEIDLFTNVLSDMHSSLKLRIPRFQNLVTIPTVEPVDHLVQSSPTKTFPVVNEEMKNVDNSPVLSDLDTFVSPSPLVSWCAERTAESGRQLFLLTPLPRSRKLSSKLRGSSQSIFARNMAVQINDNLGTPSLLTVSQNEDHGLPEGNVAKLTPGKCSQPSTINEVESSLDHRFVSPPKFVSRSRSMLLTTPRLKMSPPKSCVLLEPIKESHQPNERYLSKRTPFRVGVQTRTATPYRSEDLEGLTLKYVEQFGTQQGYTSKTERKEVDALVDCPISPPKTCVLMEPEREPWMNFASNGGMSKTCIPSEQTKCVTAAPNKGVQREKEMIKQAPHYELGSTSKAYVECTPMLKEPESTIHRGRRPGENTLKKELWTRFEAASSAPNVLRLDTSVLEDASGKGFLDRLDEVYCEEIDGPRT